MEIYYPPPAPFIGGQQPLAPGPLLTPPGGATANPVFAAASLAATLIAAWSATAAPLPQTAPTLIPPPAPSAPPPQRAGTRPEILAAWLLPALQPPAAVLLHPPIAGSAPQAPPLLARRTEWGWPAPDYLLPPRALIAAFSGPPPSGPPSGARTGAVEISIWWAARDAQPPVAVLLDPPIAGPAPQAPPLLARRTEWGWPAPDYLLPPRALIRSAAPGPGPVVSASAPYVRNCGTGYVALAGDRGGDMPKVRDLPDVAPSPLPIGMAIDFGPAPFPGAIGLPPDVTLVGTPTITIGVHSGTDANPTSRLVAGPTIGTEPISQGGSSVADAAILWQVANCIGGVIYFAAVSCLRSDGLSVQAWTRFRCIAPY